jgi:uncharacterized protein (TIGR03437 family)
MNGAHCIPSLAGRVRSFALHLLLVCAAGAMLPSDSEAASEAVSCVTGASTQTIPYGTVAACTIDFPANDESDVFQFSAAAGDLITLVLKRTVGTGLVCMELEHIFGTDIAGPACTTQSTRIDWLFTAAGTFSVDVYLDSGLQPTSYIFTLERIAPPSPTSLEIELGQARGNEINPGGDLDLYHFDGTAGQNVTVSVFRTGIAGTACLEVFGPDRNFATPTICDSATAARSFTLTSTGTFIVMVYSQNHSTPLEYSVQVVCNSGCPVTPPFDLTQCLTPRSVQASAEVGGADFKRFVAVGNDDLPNCSLPSMTDFTASVTVLNGGNWLTVSPASGTFIPGARNTVAAVINPAIAGGAGTYQALIQVNLLSLNQSVRIPMTLTLTAGPLISLSWNSFAFQTVENTPAPPPQIMRIYNGVPGTLNWTISPAEPATFPPWLSISPLAGTAGHLAGQGSPVTISVSPAGLTAGTTNIVYNALVKVEAQGATNSPQYVSVTFHVVRITAAPVPLLTAYGLVFRHIQGGVFPVAQNFVLSNTGGGFVTAALSTTTQTGGNWLTLSKTSSTASTSSGPDSVSVFVNPSGLSPGFYRGTIRGSFTAERNTGVPVTNLPDQEVDVVLIVEAAVAPAISAQRSDNAANGCAPTRMEIVGATVGNGLNAPVSFPQPLLVQVLDDCGQGVTAATAVAIADGQSVPLEEVGGGLYSGTWTPPATNAAASVAFSLFHPNLGSAQQTFTVAAVASSGGTVLPALFNQGVVEGAGFSQGRPLVPGGIISLFGSNLAPSIGEAATIPLERNLLGTRVRIGNQDAPLYFVSPGQINAQLPFEAVPGQSVVIVVNVNGRLTTPQLYQISPAQPGIFIGSNGAAVLDEAFQPVTPQNPARIGRVIQVFANGLGFTDPPVGSGEAGFASGVEIPVSVTIGGVAATVQYAGLAPNFVGLYQVNAVVPEGVPPGDAVSLVITQDGIPSNPDFPATLPVAP